MRLARHRPPATSVASSAPSSSERFGGRADEVLQHPRYRLHVLTSRGRHLLRREGRLRTPLGYMGAFATNLVSRRALGGWLERVMFSDPREPLPFPLHDYRTTQVALTAGNLSPSLLASCSVPFWLDAVHDIAGAPRGAYWDGGITDYHLHLDYAQMRAGPGAVPALPVDGGTGLARQGPAAPPRSLGAAGQRGAAGTERGVGRAELPGGKLPDRSDFKAYGDDVAGRVKAWTRALAREPATGRRVRGVGATALDRGPAFALGKGGRVADRAAR